MPSSDPGSTCIDTLGSYECKCEQAAGYMSGPPPCHDIDECKFNNHMCSDNSDCFNTIGSYFCKCKSGYQGSDCTDVNECELEMHVCNYHSKCIDLPGGYEEGYLFFNSLQKS